MNKEDMIKELEWSPEEIKELDQKKKIKAHNLLLKLINKGDEEGALMITYDKSLEANANVNHDDHFAVYSAIKKGMVKFVKESFQDTSKKDSEKLNLDFKGSKEKVTKDKKYLAEQIAHSNNPKMYDLIEYYKKNKVELLNDTLYYAANTGQLKLIKHLLNKKVEENYVPINMRAAINGYSSLGSILGQGNEKCFLLASYFADIENQTQNIYVDKKTKKLFFNKHLFINIKTKQDENTLELYKNINSKEQIIEDMIYLIKDSKISLDNKSEKSMNDFKWLFLQTIEIDYSSNEKFNDVMNEYPELKQYYDKIKLNNKLQENLLEKEGSDKKLKI